MKASKSSTDEEKDPSKTFLRYIRTVPYEGEGGGFGEVRGASGPFTFQTGGSMAPPLF